MTQSAPGKHFRKGLTLAQVLRMFPDDATAEAWFVKSRWPNGVRCPHCGSDNIQSGASHPTMPLRCRSCRKRFSVKTGTVMQSSNLGYQVWALAGYLMSTNLKGVSSMKMHRDLGVSYRTAWHLAHRLRETWQRDRAPFSGPVEVDETYIGGKRKTLTGRGAAGKTAIAGAKDRETNQVTARAVKGTDGATLQGFVRETAKPGASVYTDDRHMDRYVAEFAGRHNVRPRDTADQMEHMARGMVGKRLRYRDLVA